MGTIFVPRNEEERMGEAHGERQGKKGKGDGENGIWHKELKSLFYVFPRNEEERMEDAHGERAGEEGKRGTGEWDSAKKN